MKNIIDVIDISVKYGSQLVLTDLNFHVSRGEIFGFIGPSGSGKTTIINTLLGIIKPYKGSSKIFEKDSQTLKSSDLTQLGIMSDAIGYYERLSIFENLQIYAHIFGISEKKVDDLLSKVGLIKQKNMKTGNISVGMLQRMLFVRALINSPKLLFLDEPTSGLDPTIARNIRNEIKNLQKKGTTIFLTSHNMHEVTPLCDKIALLNNGQIIEQGSPKDIINKYIHEKEVLISFNNEHQKKVSFDDLTSFSSLRDVYSIHSIEPTLEEIFIKLTERQ